MTSFVHKVEKTDIPIFQYSSSKCSLQIFGCLNRCLIFHFHHFDNEPCGILKAQAGTCCVELLLYIPNISQAFTVFSLGDPGRHEKVCLSKKGSSYCKLLSVTPSVSPAQQTNNTWPWRFGWIWRGEKAPVMSVQFMHSVGVASAQDAEWDHCQLFAVVCPQHTLLQTQTTRLFFTLYN